MRSEFRHRGCALSRIYQLRKTKTNIQILQQNVLLKQKYMVTFLRQHGPEVFHEMRSAYVETLSRVLSSHFRSYLAALERLQVSAVLTVSEERSSRGTRHMHPLLPCRLWGRSGASPAE